MTEAIFGLLGVLIGAGLTWYQTYWMNKKEIERNARYLAIRVVCILDQYMENCAHTMNDIGLRFGDRNAEVQQEPRVGAPESPVYPEDVDWKSIDHELMYKILAFPSEVNVWRQTSNEMWEIAQGTDLADWYSERAYWHSNYGLQAFKLSKELGAKYGIKGKSYPAWNPEKDFTEKLDRFATERGRRMARYQEFLHKVYNRP